MNEVERSLARRGLLRGQMMAPGAVIPPPASEPPAPPPVASGAQPDAWNALTARAKRAEAELAEVRAELTEHQRLFDLQWRRMQDATALWRAEVPAERALVMPDLGNLLGWLIARSDRAVAAEAELLVEREQLRKQLAKTLDALMAGGDLRERFVQRTLSAETAEADLRRQVDAVRALAAEWSRKCLDPADAFALSRNELLAALDGPTDTEGPTYRWRVMFVSRAALLAGEQDMGRHDFAIEAEARTALDGWRDRVDEYWRIELRRQLTSDWETVEDTGYAATDTEGQSRGE